MNVKEEERREERETFLGEVRILELERAKKKIREKGRKSS